jgi:hypothetical protein
MGNIPAERTALMLLGGTSGSRSDLIEPLDFQVASKILPSSPWSPNISELFRVVFRDGGVRPFRLISQTQPKYKLDQN